MAPYPSMLSILEGTEGTEYLPGKHETQSPKASRMTPEYTPLLLIQCFLFFGGPFNFLLDPHFIVNIRF